MQTCQINKEVNMDKMVGWMATYGKLFWGGWYVRYLGFYGWMTYTFGTRDEALAYCKEMGFKAQRHDKDR